MMLKNNKIFQIGVIGGSEIDPQIYEIAFQVGGLIAKAGYILICGGGGGVMEAACRGAKEAGGLTVGILPGSEAELANAFVDIKIPTGLGYSRNAIVVQSSDGIIAIDGKYGTLSEIAYGFIYSKHIVGIKCWEIEGLEIFDKAEEAFVRLIQKLNSGVDSRSK